MLLKNHQKNLRVARQNGQTTPGLHLTNETWVPNHSLRPSVSLYNVYRMPQQTCLKERESESQETTCVGLACVIPALLFTCIVEEKPALVDRKGRCIDLCNCHQCCIRPAAETHSKTRIHTCGTERQVRLNPASSTNDPPWMNQYNNYWLENTFCCHRWKD